MTTRERNNIKGKGKQKIKNITSMIFLGLSIVIILILVFLFYEFGAQPIIIILILVFSLLTIVGPFYRRKSKSHYSRMFPDKAEAKRRQRRQKQFIKQRVEPDMPEIKEIRAVDLDIKYRGPTKTHTLKCSKCGMLLPNFLKKCPICKQPVIDSI